MVCAAVTLLPVEVVERYVLPRLPCRSLGALARTCRHFSTILRSDHAWLCVYERRFGRTPWSHLGDANATTATTTIDAAADTTATVSDKPAGNVTSHNNSDTVATSSSARSEYIRRTDPLISVAAFDTVVWLNGHYLDLVASDDSPFGREIHVKAVCWLDMHTRVTSVERGCYLVLWRVERDGGHRDTPFPYSWGEVSLSASPIDPTTGDTADVESSSRFRLHAGEFRSVSDSSNHNQSNGKLWLCGDGVLRVHQQFGDVLLRVSDTHSGQWKSGVKFDCVALRKLSGDPDSANAEFEAPQHQLQQFLQRQVYPRVQSVAHHSQTLLQPDNDAGAVPPPERAFGVRREELTDEFDEFDSNSDGQSDDVWSLEDAGGAHSDIGVDEG